jgi:hypothetical protein
MQHTTQLGGRTARRATRGAAVSRRSGAHVVCVAAPVAPAATVTPQQAAPLVVPTAVTKLPAAHLESSKRALAQLQESAVNRECGGVLRGKQSREAHRKGRPKLAQEALRRRSALQW